MPTDNREPLGTTWGTRYLSDNNNTSESTDTFDFSGLTTDPGSDSSVGSTDLNELGINWQTGHNAPDDDEPGLAGVVIYSDLNNNDTPDDTTFDFDFIA